MTEFIPYVVGLLSLGASFFLSLRSANSGERSELMKRLDNCEDTLQIMRRREVWHESNLDLAVRAIRSAGGQVPEFSPPPAVYPVEAT